MATTIITKFGSGAPAASDVVRGELAVDTENKRLYTEDSGGSVVELGTNPAANVTFGDNVKAIFGDGSDLQIYHDASDSIINDNGTGSLKLQQGGSTKLEVTTTGIDVTGTVTADGLTVDGTGSVTQSSNAATALMTFTNANAGASARSAISFASDTGSSVVGTVSSGWTVDALSANETFLYGSNGVSLFAPASQDVRILAGGSEKLVVKSSGNVGIGTSSPDRELDLVKSGDNCVMSITSGTSNIAGIVFGDTDDDDQSGILHHNTGNYLYFNTSSTEAMRIDSSQNLLVGGTSVGALDSCAIENYGGITISRTSGSGRTMMTFKNAATTVGIISTTTTSTTYGTSSDQRLKENIVDAPSASDDIDAIQVRSFDWKVDGSHQKYGMVAQELVTVAPEAVSAPEDPEEMMGVDYSKLVPMLIKEVQQLRARVAQLEGAN